jgi:hypothetical protein
MSNHYNLVLHVEQKRVRGWTAQQMVDRWTAVLSTPIVEYWEQDMRARRSMKWQRNSSSYGTAACDVGWFIRCLNE